MRRLLGLFLLLLFAPNAAAGVVVGRITPAEEVAQTVRWTNSGWDGGGTYPMILPDPNTEGKVYLISDVTGQWSSSNHGDTWEWMNRPTIGANYPSVVQAGIAQSKSSPDIMYIIGTQILKSTDRGASWAWVATQAATRTTCYKVIAIHPTNPDIVYFGLDNGQIMKTVDGGVTLTLFDTPFGVNVKPNFLHISPDGTRLFVGSLTSHIKIYNLSDGTSSIYTFTGDNNSNSVRDFAEYTLNGTYTFCVATGIRIACTTDAGVNWTYTSPLPVTTENIYTIKRMAAKVTAANDVRYIVSYNKVADQYSGGLFKSVDGGVNWENATGTKNMDRTRNPTRTWYLSSTPAFTLAYDPFDEDVIYRADDWGIFRSDDNGVTWNEKITGAQNTVTMSMTIAPNGNMFATAMDNGIVKSVDGGVTWTSALPKTGSTYLTGHYWRIETTGSLSNWNNGTGKVIATSSQWSDFYPRVHRSADNGKTWTTSTGLPSTIQLWNGMWGVGYPRGLTVAADNQNIMYVNVDGYRSVNGVTTNGGVFKSTNNGVSWTRVTSPSSSPNSWKAFNALLIDPAVANGQRLILGTFGAGVYQSTDGGTSWTQRQGPSISFDAGADSRNWLYLTAMNSGPSLWRSKDGGATWTEIWRHPNAAGFPTRGIHPIAFDPNYPNRCAIGIDRKGEIWLSQNIDSDTPTFDEITFDFPVYMGGYDLLFHPTNSNLYIATGGANIFKINMNEPVPPHRTTGQVRTTGGISFE